MKIDGNYHGIVEFSKLTRIFHWLRALAIVLLVVTGFYIGYPFIAPNGFTPFLYALFRSWHIIFGFLLIAVTIFRIYIFLLSKECHMERRSFKDVFNIFVWISLIKTYLLVGAHPKNSGSYNPLQLVTYIGVMILILLISITGLVLYAHVYHNGLGGLIRPLTTPVEVLCGGIANVRLIHHILTWAFIIFLPVHVYMVVWNANRFPGSGADTIISGVKFEKNEH